MSQSWPQANAIGTEHSGREVAINSDKSMQVEVLETAQNEEQKQPRYERTDMIKEELNGTSTPIRSGVGNLDQEDEVVPIGFEDAEAVFKYKDYSMDPVEENEAPFTSV